MMISASKLLLLSGLVVGSIEIAVSTGAEEGRGLSFQHPTEGPSLDPSHVHVVPFSSKSGKSSKSKGKGDKNSKDFGKGLKSEKKEKYFHVGNDYEVHYEIVMTPEHTESDKSSKSGKSRPTIPEFEYIEIGHKSYKASKSAKSEYEDSDYYGNKSAKASKYEGYDTEYYDYDSKSAKSGKSASSKLPSKFLSTIFVFPLNISSFFYDYS